MKLNQLRQKMERSNSFGFINHYKPEIQKCRLSYKTRVKWGLQFLFNFTFEINKLKDDSNGNSEITKKTEAYGNVSEKLRLKINKEFRDKHKTLFDQPLPLPEIKSEDLTKGLFKKWRLKANMPLVIKGLIKDSYACENWSTDWLGATFGDEKVLCVPPEFSTEKGEKVKLKEVRVRDYFSKDEYKQYYINNHHSIFGPNDFYQNCKGRQIEELRGSRSLIDQWFISRSKKTGSPLHCANGDNLFLNIKGRKEWHFIHPSYTPIVSPLLSKYAIYAIADIENSLFADWESIYERHPMLKYVPIYKVVLEEGDVLFNPSWWWHSVRNLEDFTIGCATRFMAPRTSNNISVFSYCQMIEAVKHPRKSVIPQSLSMLLSRKVNKNLLVYMFSKE